MTKYTTEVDNYDFQNALDKINDAIGRVMRHKDFHHEGKNANDLQIIIVQLQAALHSLAGDKSGERLGETDFMQQAKEALDA